MHSIVIEVSGSCNARCPYCHTGKMQQEGPIVRRPFMTSKLFQDVIARLEELGFIDRSRVIDLHNWGEPFLNPEIGQILEHINERGHPFRMSTNAAVFPSGLHSGHFRHLNQMVVSMPGFSQDSYDRIHSLRFETVLRNVDRIIHTMGNRRVNVCMHAYRFNSAEIEAAKSYFRVRGVRFSVYPAFFNDYEQAKDHLTNSLQPDLAERAGCELILDGVQDLLASRPTNYSCPQWSMLTIDETAHCLTCCLVPRTSPDYSLGSLFELSAEQIHVGKRDRAICRECTALKMDYWVHASPYYLSEAYFRLPRGRLKTAFWRIRSMFGRTTS